MTSRVVAPARIDTLLAGPSQKGEYRFMAAVERAAEALTLGWQELERGGWANARQHFARALREAPTAEAHDGLAWAAWWLNDAEATFRERETAYGLYREQGDAAGAARMALWLGTDNLDFRGEPAVAAGWWQRAERLLQGSEQVPEHGWLAMMRGDLALQMEEDTTTARRHADEAAAIGRKTNVVELEMLGLALRGICEVTEGRVQEGMRCLDEAVTAALGGEFRQLHGVGWTTCYLIYACERVRDLDRAAQWCKKLEEFTERMGIRFVLGVCRAHYASVLVARGSFTEAEQELDESRRELETSRPAWVVESVVRLGELRRRQGRVEEASALFGEVEFHPLAMLGLAALTLDRGAAAEAAERAEALLRELPGTARTQRAPALELLVRARAVAGDHGGAGQALRELVEATDGISTPTLRAAVAYSQGVVAVAGGDYHAARRSFEDAARLFGRSRAPFETAAARLELASVLEALDRREAALRESMAARRLLEDLGATMHAARAAALTEKLRGKAHPSPSALSKREREVLALVAQGCSDKQIAQELTLSVHTVHRHVANVLAKAGCRSRAAAAARAAKEGWI